MKIKTGIKKRDELTICIRDMAFVACGTILVVTGHIWFAIVSFVAACVRLDLMPAITFAKYIRYVKSVLRIHNKHVMEMTALVSDVLDSGVSRGMITQEEAKAMKEKLKYE